MGKAIEYEEKLKIVQAYLAGEIGYGEAVKAAHNSERSFRQWVWQYENGGATALLPQGTKTHYTAKKKYLAVRAYLAGMGSMEAICKKYGIVSINTFRKWIMVYNTHGDFNSVKHSGGGSYMRQGRDTTREERLEIVRDCLASGKNYGEMALKYHVSYQQVRTWTLKYEKLGEAGLEDRRGKRKKDQTPRTELEAAQIEIERLKHQLYLAELERDLLKNWTRSRGGMASHK